MEWLIYWVFTYANQQASVSAQITYFAFWCGSSTVSDTFSLRGAVDCCGLDLFSHICVHIARERSCVIMVNPSVLVVVLFVL